MPSMKSGILATPPLPREETAVIHKLSTCSHFESIMQENTNRIWLPIGAIVAGISVFLGAFGAHGLETFLQDQHAGDAILQERRLDNWSTATRYQMYHAIGLMVVGLSSHATRARLAKMAAFAMLTGTLVFSGCLYLLVLTGLSNLGAIVPIGGVAQLIGWALLAAAAWPRPHVHAIN